MNSNYEIVRELIEYNCDGVDKYIHNNNTWLIFTDDKKWVIELTKDGTLWYNYNFFKDVFKYLSLDVVENQHYITKWVEDTVINGVKRIQPESDPLNQSVEETIINGVKETIYRQMGVVPVVENTIINGVKHTEYGDWLDGDSRFDDIIENGVKDTIPTFFDAKEAVEDTITNGVKHTVASDCLPSVFVEDTIQNGVKHTEKSLQIDGSCVVEDVIQNGIKETHDDVYHHKGRVDGVIKNGIKETKLIDYSENTEFIVNGVISRGIKE